MKAAKTQGAQDVSQGKQSGPIRSYLFKNYIFEKMYHGRLTETQKSTMLRQIEFYFSDANLPFDDFMNEIILKEDQVKEISIIIFPTIL